MTTVSLTPKELSSRDAGEGDDEARRPKRDPLLDWWMEGLPVPDR